MYGHLSALKRMGTAAADIPTGSSMGVDRSGGGGREPVAATGWGAKGGLQTQSSAIADAAAQNGLRTTAVGGPRVGGNSNVHGFASKTAAAPAMHNHASSFQRAKGVVNTVGGARDVTRAEKADAPRLPPKGEAKAQIMGFSTLDQHTLEGKARREAAEKREKAGGNTHGMKLVHVSGGGGRGNLGGGGGGVEIHRLGDDSKKDRPSARYGGLQPTMGVAPTKEIRASRVVSAAPAEGYSTGRSGTALGGGAASGNVIPVAHAPANDREKRLAFFAKKEAEDAARKALQAQ